MKWLYQKKLVYFVLCITQFVIMPSVKAQSFQYHKTYTYAEIEAQKKAQALANSQTNGVTGQDLSLPLSAKKLLIIGESLSTDYKVPPQTSWPDQTKDFLLEEMPHWTLVNASMANFTVRNAHRHMKRLLEDTQPHLVVLQLGSTDIMQGATPKQIYKYMSKLVHFVQSWQSEQNFYKQFSSESQQEASILVIASGLNADFGEETHEAFIDLFQKISINHSTSLIPHLFKALEAHHFLNDKIHLSEKGHTLVSQTFIDQLKPLLFCIDDEKQCPEPEPESESASKSESNE